jgi:hypothetical protein
MGIILLHIGHYKCGTSSLQRRFANHRDWLRERGLVYPDLGLLTDPRGREIPSHSALPFEYLRGRGAPGPLWYRDALERSPSPPTLESLLGRLHEELADAGERDVIISSEEFMRFGESERMEGLVDEFADQLVGHDVEVFCYLRRHDQYLASWYNQLVKMGGLAENLSQDIERFAAGIHGDYAKALRPWVQRFGTEHVTVRRYEHRQGDVAEDFLRHMGHAPDLPEGSGVWENPRFPDLFIEPLRHWNHLQAPAWATERMKAIMVELAASPELSGVVVDVLDRRAREHLHRSAVTVEAALEELLGLAEPLFDDLDAILTPLPNSIGDRAANNRFGPRATSHFFAEVAPTPEVVEPTDATEADEISEPDPSERSPWLRSRMRTLAGRVRRRAAPGG